MKKERQNYQKLNLERYLKKKVISGRSKSCLATDREELLRLVLAYERKKQNLHLRWNRNACIELGYITIDELFERKKKDPLLNKVYDRLVEQNNLPDTVLRDLLLEAAERILNDTRARNIAISKKPRKRKKHPLKLLLEELVDSYPRNNHNWLRDKVIALGIKDGIIYQNDKEREKIIFKNPQTIDITYKTVSTWVKEIKSNKKSDLTG